MSHNNSNMCKWASLAVSCVMGAIGLQLIIILIGIAVSAAVADAPNLWRTVALLFNWPVFFLSLLAAITGTVGHLMKQCCGKQWHCNSKDKCCDRKNHTAD